MVIKTLGMTRLCCSIVCYVFIEMSPLSTNVSLPLWLRGFHPHVRPTARRWVAPNFSLVQYPESITGQLCTLRPNGQHTGEAIHELFPDQTTWVHIPVLPLTGWRPWADDFPSPFSILSSVKGVICIEYLIREVVKTKWVTKCNTHSLLLLLLFDTRQENYFLEKERICLFLPIHSKYTLSGITEIARQCQALHGIWWWKYPCFLFLRSRNVWCTVRKG